MKADSGFLNKSLYTGGFRLQNQSRIPPLKSKPDSGFKGTKFGQIWGPGPAKILKRSGGLGWAGLGLVGLAGLGWAGLGQAGPDWAGLDWADWSGPGSAPKMVKTNGKIQKINSSRLCPHRFSNRNNLCKRLSKENSSLVVERETKSVLTKKEQLRVTVPWSPKMLPFSGRNFKAVFRNRISSFSTTANFRNFYSRATCELCCGVEIDRVVKY